MAAASQRLQNEAARWFMRMRDAAPDHADRGRFEAWLLADPAHANEYAAFAETWEDFATTSKLQSLAQAMERRKNQLAKQRDRIGKLARHSLLSVMLLAMGGLFGLQMWREWQAQPLMEVASATGIGEIGRQTLDDGTKLVLNADTRIRVAYFRDRREIVMERGEVIFDVARDPQRPFTVDSGHAKITVLGTRFAVNRLEHLVRVSVDHGRVKVEAQDAQGRAREGYVILSDGQVAEVGQGDVPRLVQRSAHDAFSFQNGTLVFSRATLSEIAETLSRFRTAPVSIAPGKTADTRVTAVVQANSIERFIKLLPRIAPVRIEHAPDQARIVPAR
jgi:transmembrane sensor